MNKGVKFRAYPNKEQQNLIGRTFGCCRLIYNKGLAMRDEAYESGERIGYYQTSAMLPGLKRQSDFAFLKDVDSIALQLTNRRNDFLQKQSTILVRENQTICIEDLNVKGMLRNHKLAKYISSVSWSKFFTMSKTGNVQTVMQSITEIPTQVETF